MKEVMLEELNDFTTKNNMQSIKNEESKENNASSSNGPIIAKPNIMKGSSISTSDLSKRLKEKHDKENESSTKSSNDVEETPMIKNAFSDMLKTLDDRKRKIDEELMPIIEKNAEEMAMAEELGIDTSKERLDDENVQALINKKRNEIEESSKPTNFNDTSDIDNILNDGDEEDMERIMDTTNNYTSIDNPVAEPPVKEEVNTVVEEVKPATVTVPKKEDTVEQTSKNLIEDDEDDLDKLMNDLNASNDENTSIQEEETVEELRSRFKETLSSVKIARDPIDFSKFKIKQNAVSSAAILSTVNNKINNFKKADWVLYHTGRSMTFTECRGPELNALRKSIGNSNDINAVIASLQFVYNHTIDANKPPFEAWCKLIRTEDIESLYFGLYRACYADSNIVARACQNKGCEKTSLIDTDIKKMIKFKDKETEEKFYKIFNHDTTTSTQETESELMQISDYFAISFSHPTLYSTFLQYATLPSNVTDKYSDTLNTMAYIDGFYSIDYNTNELIPIAIKTYKNNLNKTVINKLKTYIEILKTLTNDQYNILTAKLNNIIQEPKISYVYPETTCPECGATIKEEPIESVIRLLFTRAQLVQVKSL